MPVYPGALPVTPPIAQYVPVDNVVAYNDVKEEMK